MKELFAYLQLAVLIFVAHFNASAQTSSALSYQPMLNKSTWKEMVSGFDDYGMKQISYFNDTMIAGITWQKHTIKYCPIWGIGYLDTSLTNCNTFTSIFLREDTINKKIYEYNTFLNVQFLYLDFNIDTNNIYKFNSINDSLIPIDTFSIVDNLGIQHAGYTLETYPTTTFQRLYYLVEGLGIIEINDVNGFFDSNLGCFVQNGVNVFYKDLIPQYIININCDDVLSGIIDGEFELNTITLTPNPATTSFTLSGIVGASSISVYDNQGKEIAIAKASQATHQLDCNRFAAGIYFAKITTSNGTQTLKFIKN
jgi:hypothetical protein